MRIWRFAAEGEPSGVHKEESRVGKPIRKSETGDEELTLDYQRSAGFPCLSGYVIGDLDCVLSSCLGPPTLGLLLTLVREEPY